METTVLKLAAELCGAGEEDVLLQALCDAAETFWKTRVQPGPAGEVCSGVLRCAAAFTAAADYLGKNCAGGESFTVGDVTVKGMTGQSAQALAETGYRVLREQIATGKTCHVCVPFSLIPGSSVCTLP